MNGISMTTTWVISAIAGMLTVLVPLVLIIEAINLYVGDITSGSRTAFIAFLLTYLAGCAFLFWQGWKWYSVTVPNVHAAIPTFFGMRILTDHHLKEGKIVLPRWLGFWYWEDPVPPPRFVPLSSGHTTSSGELKELAQTDGEKRGFVFLGARTNNLTVSVQSRELTEVDVDGTFVFQVENPNRWKQAGNAYGTIIDRVRAGFRASVSEFNARDINKVRSLIPSILLSAVVLFVRCTKRKGSYIEGDLAQTSAGDPIVEKVDEKEEKEEKKKELVDRIKKKGDPDSYPENLEPKDVLELNLEHDLRAELDRFGAKHISMQVNDITLPENISKAASEIESERAQGRAQTIQAETYARVANIHQQTMEKHGENGIVLSMISEGKGNLIKVIGDNSGLIAAAKTLRGES